MGTKQGHHRPRLYHKTRKKEEAGAIEDIDREKYNIPSSANVNLAKEYIEYSQGLEKKREEQEVAPSFLRSQMFHIPDYEEWVTSKHGWGAFKDWDNITEVNNPVELRGLAKKNRDKVYKFKNKYYTFVDSAFGGSVKEVNPLEKKYQEPTKKKQKKEKKKEVKEEKKEVKKEEKKEEKKKEKEKEKTSLEKSLDEFANSINDKYDAKAYAGGFQANALYLAARNYKNNPNPNTKKKLEYFYNKYAK